MRRRVMTIATLNSIMFLLIHGCLVSWIVTSIRFKFHYVSINSLGDETEKKLQIITLNSIMFLLIRTMNT